jgi:predicted nucleic acid-binding protein
MTGAVLDAGALIAFERADRAVVAIVHQSLAHGDDLAVPAGVLAQVWRDGRRQARLARLLGSPVCSVVPLDDSSARHAGQTCGVAGTTDVVDASVVVLARRLHRPVVTGDVDDMHRLDPSLELIPI